MIKHLHIYNLTLYISDVLWYKHNLVGQQCMDTTCAKPAYPSNLSVSIPGEACTYMRLLATNSVLKTLLSPHP